MSFYHHPLRNVVQLHLGAIRAKGLRSLKQDYPKHFDRFFLFFGCGGAATTLVDAEDERGKWFVSKQKQRNNNRVNNQTVEVLQGTKPRLFPLIPADGSIKLAPLINANRKVAVQIRLVLGAKMKSAKFQRGETVSNELAPSTLVRINWLNLPE